MISLPSPGSLFASPGFGSAIDPSSLSSYSSALNSYITFCRAHQFPIDPTPETLSFYTVYMCHHIKPKSVDNYLSGISNQLEPFFPNVRSHRRHLLVTRTLKGCKKLRPSPVSRKRPITRTELGSLRHHYLQPSLTTHDDKLFFALLLTGFHVLLRLSELVWPDNKSLQDYRKVILRHTTHIHDKSFDFHVPGHKGDRFFEGNQVVIQRTNTNDDPFPPFVTYLVSRDRLFPFQPELWLRSDGSIPTRASVPGSYVDFINISLTMSAVTPCELVEQPLSRKPDYLQTSSKRLAGGPQRPFKFIFVVTPFYEQHSSSAIPPTSPRDCALPSLLSLAFLSVFVSQTLLSVCLSISYFYYQQQHPKKKKNPPCFPPYY